MECRVLLAIVSSWTALGVSANKGGRLLNPVSNTCKWKMPLKSYIENWKNRNKQPQLGAILKTMSQFGQNSRQIIMEN